MKFEDEAPDEQMKEGKQVERNQGAARAISVCTPDIWYLSMLNAPTDVPRHSLTRAFLGLI